MSFGAPDLPADQRSVSSYHGCWYSEPLLRPLHVFGQCQVEINCTFNTETSQVYIALCHVMKSKGGGHRLLTYGVQNIKGEFLNYPYATNNLNFRWKESYNC